jgi:ketosteroid isomerase-like protein
MNMTIEQNKKLAANVIDAISNDNWEFVNEAFDTDAVVWVAGSMPISGTHTKEFVIVAGQRTREEFPEGLSLTAKAMTAEGDRVAVEAESLGQHVSGKTYNNHFHILMEIKDGKVHTWKEYMDSMHANEVFFG